MRPQMHDLLHLGARELAAAQVPGEERWAAGRDCEFRIWAKQHAPGETKSSVLVTGSLNSGMQGTRV